MTAVGTLEPQVSEPGALAFLGDVLLGETEWSVDEVANLLALHTLVAVRRQDTLGVDDPQRSR